MDEQSKDSDSLEGKNDAVIETDSLETSSIGSAVHATPEEKSAATGKPARSRRNPLKKFVQRFNIYLLLFILVLVISGGILVITAFSQHASKDPTIASQSLPGSTLSQLSKSDTTVGDPKQVLNVQSNAVFAGKVLIRDSLDVAGQIHVSGSLSLPGITVAGESTFDTVQINKTLSVGQDASVLGQLNVKKSLSVSGNSTFGGTVTAPQIATNQLQVLSDLILTSHIVAGGVTPGHNGGNSLGSGGTASVSGSDTAGSININTGGGASAGCYINVNFAGKFNNTPHVVISPTNSFAASMNYYVIKSSTGFSVCSGIAPAAATFSFDYIVLG